MGATEEGDERAKAHTEPQGEKVFAEVGGEDEEEAAALDESGKARDAEGHEEESEDAPAVETRGADGGAGAEQQGAALRDSYVETSWQGDGPLRLYHCLSLQP